MLCPPARVTDPPFPAGQRRRVDEREGERKRHPPAQAPGGAGGRQRPGPGDRRPGVENPRHEAGAGCEPHRARARHGGHGGASAAGNARRPDEQRQRSRSLHCLASLAMEAGMAGLAALRAGRPGARRRPDRDPVDPSSRRVAVPLVHHHRHRSGSDGAGALGNAGRHAGGAERAGLSGAGASHFRMDRRVRRPWLLGRRRCVVVGVRRRCSSGWQPLPSW